MTAALTYCWKEWRAQRAMLISFTLLITACMCLGLFMAPRDLWLHHRFGDRVLVWFVGAAVLGVLVCAVPNLVSREFVGKGDQFVRRLPGALRPAFFGKSLFLLLVSVAMPLLALLVGQAFSVAMGCETDGLRLWGGEADLLLVVAQFLPWLWAVGMWLPGGRLALLGTILLGLLVLVGGYAVERQAPRIFDDVNWWRWSWAVPTLGMAVAYVSWCWGRRGGGPGRSARVGLLATMVALLPFASWVGERAIRYHYPDANKLQTLSVRGMSPDGRFVLAQGSEEHTWLAVQLRLDLETGAATRVAGIDAALTPQVVYPAPLTMLATQRYWREYNLDDNHHVFDLVTGAKHSIAYDQHRNEPQLPAELRQKVKVELSGAGGFYAPDGRRVIVDGDELLLLSDTAEEERIAYPVKGIVSMRAAGHAIESWGQDGHLFFDLARRQVFTEKQFGGGWVIGDSWLLGVRNCQLQKRGGELERCEPLRGCRVLGLVDHERVLVGRESYWRGKHQGCVFLFDPATGEQVDCTMLDGGHVAGCWAVAPMHMTGTLLQRDPAGGIWFSGSSYGTRRFVRLDMSTLEAGPVRGLTGMSDATLLRWRDYPHVVVQSGAQIVRVHIETGERTVLFPRK